jgi:hypothetical protein
MKHFHLIDTSGGIEPIQQEAVCKTAALIALKYGEMGNNRTGYSHDRIVEFWEHGTPYPSKNDFEKYAKVPQIKWYIHNKVNNVLQDDGLWSSDFLHGLLSHGKISWNKRRYPSFEWFNNSVITKLLRSCPFSGRILECKCDNQIKAEWSGVPALYLPYSVDGIDFMTGAMCGLKLAIKDGQEYAQMTKRAVSYFKKWGIPIEKEQGPSYFISPMWPALFAPRMPNDIGKTWTNLKHACNVNLYAPVLWKTYVNNEFPVKGIPYLKSRRTIFYQFGKEEGAMGKIERLRVDCGLTELDNRIGAIVKEWKTHD